MGCQAMVSSAIKSVSILHNYVHIELINIECFLIKSNIISCIQWVTPQRLHLTKKRKIFLFNTNLLKINICPHYTIIHRKHVCSYYVIFIIAKKSKKLSFINYDFHSVFVRSLCIFCIYFFRIFDKLRYKI